MTKVTMPDPAAWLLACQTYAGDTAWNLSWTRSGAGTCHRLSGEEYEKPLITTDQAEAYKDDCVRVALEEAETIVRNNADASYSMVKEVLDSNADAIRALIPTTK